MTAVVYVGGTGRSGSTVLARLLAGVPGVVAVGELRYVLERGWTLDHLCGCGRPFRSCPFWAEVFGRALPGADDAAVARLQALARRVDRNRYVPAHVWSRARTPAFRAALGEYTGFLARLYAAVADVSGAGLVVDSSKDPSYAFVLRSTPQVDLRVLHLVRDSRAVAFSWTRRRVRPEVHTELRHMATRSPWRSGALWTGYHLLLEWLARHAASVRRVRYEDFVADADGELARLTAWLEVEGRVAGPTEVHDISGNPVRFSSEPLAVRADDEWQRAMPTRDYRVVTALTWPLLRRYGYGKPLSR